MSTTTEIKVFVNDGATTVMAVEVKEAIVEAVIETREHVMSKGALEFADYCNNIVIKPEPKKKVTEEDLDACRVKGKVGDTGYMSDMRLHSCSNPECDGNQEYMVKRIEYMRDLLAKLGFEQPTEAGWVTWPHLGEDKTKAKIMAKVKNKGRMWAGIKYIKSLRSEFFGILHMRKWGFNAMEVAADNPAISGGIELACPFCGETEIRTKYMGRRKAVSYGWQVRQEIEETYEAWGIHTEDILLRSNTTDIIDGNGRIMASCVGYDAIYQTKDVELENMLWEQDMDNYRLEVAGPACTKESRFNKVTQYKMIKHSSEWWNQWREDRAEYDTLVDESFNIADALA